LREGVMSRLRDAGRVGSGWRVGTTAKTLRLSQCLAVAVNESDRNPTPGAGTSGEMRRLRAFTIGRVCVIVWCRGA